MFARDATNDPRETSWIADANGHADFPLQNLPIAVFRRRGSAEAWRGGVAIGEQIVDLGALLSIGALPPSLLDAARLATATNLDGYLAAGSGAWQALRQGLFAALHRSAAPSLQQGLQATLVPQADAEYRLASSVPNYTDFYTSIHHARNVGRLWRPDDPLTPNFQWLPIAYHGRASSVVVSGTDFHRPMGQVKPTDGPPVQAPCARLDYELELGLVIGPGNGLGQPIRLVDAENHIAGLCLLNDWSARDIQFWEMAPLGPFLGKNFCTSVSPWLVSLQALAPYRAPLPRDPGDPPLLPYLDDPINRSRGAIDIGLTVHLHSASQRERGLPPTRLSATTFRHQYWTAAQMVAQHTMGGCNLQSGDLIGTGTISGPTPAEAGAIIELSRGGREPIALEGGESRAFLEDGDRVILQGRCRREGEASIGLGQCAGTVLPVRR